MSGAPFRRVAVYCGSSERVRPVFIEAARAVGAALASRGIGVVYGGGRVGLMGAVADGALAAGGHVTGVIPRSLLDLELGHTGVSELMVVDGMHTRKACMAALSDAFIALPGGWGTLEELFEVTTWTQLGFHKKPVGIFNVDGYYDPLLVFLARAAAERFVHEVHGSVLQWSDDLEALLAKLEAAVLPDIAQWITSP